MLSKVQGCLMGVAIGDALGMPVETMSHEKIMAETQGIGVTDFIDPINRREWVKELKAGDTTDDWQLTRAVANSLIRCHGQLDITDCANEHVFELNRSLFGWGKGTQSAIEAIKLGERVVGRDPLPAIEPNKGCGNGVVMKVAPLPISKFTVGKKGSDIWQDVKALGSMTHHDIRASISAYAVAAGLQMVFEQQLTNVGRHYFLEIIIRAVETVEKAEGVTTQLVSERLNMLSGAIGNAEALRKAVGCGFHAIDTAAFTIGTFMRHPTDFRSGVLEAVNAGGDTDTNASVVGGLIGANVGIEMIPEEWKSFNPAFNEALDLGQRLCFE